MMPNGRKLAGTLLLLGLMLVYVFLAMLVAIAVLPRAGPVAQFAYYAIAGLAWVPVAAVIVSWMHRR